MSRRWLLIALLPVGVLSTAAAGRAHCAAGYALDLDALLAGRRELSGVPPRPGDLWIDLGGSGAGIVSAVAADPERGLAIQIRHLACTPPRVCVDDFYFQLHGRGHFFR